MDTLDGPRLALQFAVDLGQHWPTIVDDGGQVLRRYGSGPPVTLFVDGAGTVVRVETEPFRDLAALRQMVTTYLG